MKKVIFSLVTLCCIFSAAFAQPYEYLKRPAVGIHLFAVDFATPQKIKNSSLNDVLKNHEWTKPGDMNYGLAFNYMRGLTNHFDFSTSMGLTFVEYPIKGKSQSYSNALIEWDAMAFAKMFSDKHLISPYLSAGIGASEWSGYWGAIIPVGVGMQVNISNEAFVLINSQYRIGVTPTTSDHFYHSIGIAGNVGKKKEVKVIPPPPPPVVIQKDADSDGDGIADKEDKCPTVPGIARYQGCPIPDTDNDGINDEEDKCIDVAGLARYQGCPIPDRDNDGVNDEEDKCPDVAGPIDNGGCPKLETAKFNAAAVQFVLGSAKLTPAAKKTLDEGANILNVQYPQLKVEVAGHTDNTGSVEFNRKLSEKRAQSVINYLVSRGVSADRLTAVGYGQDQPIAENNTSAGRTKNRRVEFKVSQ
ncbi:OmpA family protein [Flavihumibacter profundi]|uniref:OmpA family protein n=1 Tax=Flavihumibacter profundi TaxID=2716883 RepID=UPI001CC5D310|nr:OmpA family protein [Flavihumibacter profundi]MBZ5856729.1 OmpA family protein [Flavihumibacter profundi]